MPSKKKFKKYAEINMDTPTRKDLLSLIHAYLINEIDTEKFTDDIVINFYQEWNGAEGYFNAVEYEEVRKIFHASSWYSDYESDHAITDGWYYSHEVREIVENSAKILPVL